ncbi:MAG: hypothetical protein GF317_24970 [Candidatus Lokiarchaeota archaeon]|nr:hypothetical protein [Candidatus Lokiarchaeota archaeon]MBD3202612.1 hypothetical protein [Candidatus Lokiarchaeota archaeon]
MKKIYKKNASIIFISIILFSMFFGFGSFIFLNNGTTLYNGELEDKNQLKAAQIEKNDIRIAIYSESNITRPDYAIINSILTNNFVSLTELLSENNYDYTNLSTNDIYNHKLVTAEYDVLILADNLPREKIVNHVKEFWLGGGSILSFDSSLSYLMYTGIIIPESEGDENFGTYWSYFGSTDLHNISVRHPTTKQYQMDDDFNSTMTDTGYMIWSAAMGSIIADDLTRLSNVEGDNNKASGVALYRSDKGGKIVQLPGNGEEIDPTYEDLILDSIQWLCPTPKARIAYDLSHDSYYGIDSWDSDYVTFSNRYSIWRDNMVNRSYTVDKLYPSIHGNLTSQNLDKYDVLVLMWPGITYSTSEKSAVQNWINNGGSLLILGDDGGGIRNQNLNDLIDYSEMSLSLTSSGSNTMSYFNQNHPITEGCSQIIGASVGIVDAHSPAVNLTGADMNTISMASQEIGKGRIVLMADVNAMDNIRFNTDDNKQYFINVFNWISANEARVLTYVVDNSSPDPNDNIYQGPVSKALNSLGEPFYITFEDEYFNLSLVNYDWDLVVIDNTQGFLTILYFNELFEYLKNGGKLILSTWEYYRSEPIPLWEYIGFKYENTILIPPTLNLWSTSHPIFNNPIDYDSTKIETSTNIYGTDANNLTIYSNATAYAGLTISSQNTSCSIILGASGRALVNGFLLTEYSDDTDDSTYPDSLEIWMNEIYYMLPKTISSGGIPGYELVFFSLITIGIIGLISIFTYRNKIRK